MAGPAQPTRATAYGRDVRGDKAPSVDAQRHQVDAWARRTKTKIARWFIDKAECGRVEERPALMAALSTLGPESRILCVAVPDVLHHDPSVRKVAEHIAKHAGGAVIYATVGGATNADPSELDRLLDAHERMLLRLQLMRAEPPTKRPAATWGRVPWGYRLSADGMSLEPNPTERAVVAVARHMRLRGLKLRQIADELRKLGVVSRTGKPLGITRIYELLNEGQGSRPKVLAEGAGTDDEAPPESVVRPSLVPGEPCEPERNPLISVASGSRSIRRRQGSGHP